MPISMLEEYRNNPKALDRDQELRALEQRIYAECGKHSSVEGFLRGELERGDRLCRNADVLASDDLERLHGALSLWTSQHKESEWYLKNKERVASVEERIVSSMGETLRRARVCCLGAMLMQKIGKPYDKLLLLGQERCAHASELWELLTQIDNGYTKSYKDKVAPLDSFWSKCGE